jgi:sporulation protein YlmC with PRC-barrel domain
MEKYLTLRKMLIEDMELANEWNRLPHSIQQQLLDVDERKRVPDLLNDTVFKKIFDPDTNGEVLSQFISSVLGKKVRVLHSLKTEGNPHSIYSKKIILDLVVQFEDGSLGNVEIQRQGIHFPPQRSVCYSADLITRQYAAVQGQKKSEIDYESIKPVYNIIILEHSTEEFLSSNECIHHFSQKSNTGVQLELLQYYDYVCLDTFKEKRPHIAAELERWLADK